MKLRLLVVFCMLSLGVVSPAAGASTGIRIWHRHHKDAAKTAEAPKQKAKRPIFHRSRHTREEAAKSEAAYGMTGPKSIGGRHPQPGPAGYGAK